MVTFMSLSLPLATRPFVPVPVGVWRCTTANGQEAIARQVDEIARASAPTARQVGSIKLARNSRPKGEFSVIGQRVKSSAVWNDFGEFSEVRSFRSDSLIFAFTFAAGTCFLLQLLLLLLFTHPAKMRNKTRQGATATTNAPLEARVADVA